MGLDGTQRLAQPSKIMSTIQLRRVVVMTLLAFLIIAQWVPVAQAAEPLKLLETDWRTGEIDISYTGAIDGYYIEVWAATYETNGIHVKIDGFFAEGESGRHVTRYLENGQTVWYYIKMFDDHSNQVARSNEQKQTPPITAFIINWPDMLRDLDKMINDAIKNAMTPSQEAQDKLKDALDNLKDATGANSADKAANDLKDAIDQAQSGMRPPIVNDDGNGTYTGGNTGGQLPGSPGHSPGQLPGSPGGGGLDYPNPDSGTPTEMTMRIPYGVDMQGNLLYVQLFTQEQMEKMKWLDVIRKLCGATIWVMFAIWLVQRFTPQMKV